jgi:hypothetical protein
VLILVRYGFLKAVLNYVMELVDMDPLVKRQK